VRLERKSTFGESRVRVRGAIISRREREGETKKEVKDQQDATESSVKTIQIGNQKKIVPTLNKKPLWERLWKMQHHCNK